MFQFRSAAVALLVLATLAPAARAADLDEAVLDEINFARTHPADYARELRTAGGDSATAMYEDPAALDEAIGFLQRQPPLPPLREDERLRASARSHTVAQGARGGEGHGGGDDALGQRLQRQGLWAGIAAENISYGYGDPRDVVRQLVADSGVPNRGHRKNIFGAAYQAAGVGCGAHRVYGAMCVIDFAGAIVQR